MFDTSKAMFLGGKSGPPQACPNGLGSTMRLAGSLRSESARPADANPQPREYLGTVRTRAMAISKGPNTVGIGS